MADVTLRQIRKSYAKTEVIHGIDLDINHGEFVVFVGPSGCGKSTLLRIVAGLEEIDGGELLIGGERVNDVIPAERGVAMVFQSYALYPHMSVFENMAFALRQAKTPKDEMRQRVEAAARTLQIEDYLERLPKQLSGGQRQRVAIGRAIVRNPRVFLFDEPLSNLDAALRVQTRLEIAKLHAELDATMIYVTHDQTEAMTLADRIVVLNAGQVEQVGSPLELYRRPANRFVAEFIGSPKMNTPVVRQNEAELTLADGISIQCPAAKGHAVARVGIRPEHIVSADGQGENVLNCTLPHTEHLGEFALAHVTVAPGVDLIAKVDESQIPASGEAIALALPASHLHLFDAEGHRVGD